MPCLMGIAWKTGVAGVVSNGVCDIMRVRVSAPLQLFEGQYMVRLR